MALDSPGHVTNSFCVWDKAVKINAAHFLVLIGQSHTVAHFLIWEHGLSGLYVERMRETVRGRGKKSCGWIASAIKMN